jgi:putative transposase
MGRALGENVRERGFGNLVTGFQHDTRELLEARVGVRASCELTGLSRATLYRKRTLVPAGPEPARAAPPDKLSGAGCAELIAALNSAGFADKGPRQVWASLLDQGIYLASVSTMYRVLRREGPVRDRRDQARHQARKKPHLLATAPNDVWSWDITKLHGPVRGLYYDLYVMIGIYSRCVVHWEVHVTETGELAKDFISAAIRASGGIAPRYVHSVRGTSMTSKKVSALLSDRSR